MTKKRPPAGKPAFQYLHLKGAALWDILSDAVRNYSRNHDGNQAAAIAFYAVVSMIPLFILTLWVVGTVFGSNPRLQQELIDQIQQFSPYFSNDLLDQIGRIEQKTTILGWVGVITLLWSSTLIFDSIQTAFKAIFRTSRERNYFVLKGLAVAMIPLGWMVGMASMAVTYLASVLEAHPFVSDLRSQLGLFVQNAFVEYVLPFSVMTAFFSIVYKVVPAGRISWGNALAGGVLFSAMMEIVKHVFAWYMSGASSYGVIYGSLQTVVVLVLWVFYMALLLLFCAELISSYRRRPLILLEKVLRAEKKQTVLNERLFRRFGRVYRRGEYIFREGDEGSEIFYILLGGVQVEKKAASVAKVLAEMGPGQYFGEMAALLQKPRTASVRAVEDSEIAVISASTFRNLLRESNEISLMMLNEFSRRIGQTNEQLDALTQEWIKSTAVLYFCGRREASEIEKSVRHLAHITGKPPEDIRHALEGLQKEGILRVRDGCVADCDPAKVFDSPRSAVA